MGAFRRILLPHRSSAEAQGNMPFGEVGDTSFIPFHLFDLVPHRMECPAPSHSRANPLAQDPRDPPNETGAELNSHYKRDMADLDPTRQSAPRHTSDQTTWHRIHRRSPTAAHIRHKREQPTGRFHNVYKNRSNRLFLLATYPVATCDLLSIDGERGHNSSSLQNNPQFMTAWMPTLTPYLSAHKTDVTPHVDRPHLPFGVRPGWITSPLLS